MLQGRVTLVSDVVMQRRMPDSAYVKGVSLAVHYIMGFQFPNHLCGVDGSNDHMKWVSHNCVRAYAGVLFPINLVFEKCDRVLRCSSASCKPFLISTPEPLSLTPCVSSYKESQKCELGTFTVYIVVRVSADFTQNC